MAPDLVRYHSLVERSQTSVAVFDLGGVLVPSGGALAALAVALDVPERELAGPYWAHRDAYDVGGPAAEYWRRVTAALGRPCDSAEVARLDGIDVAHWAALGTEATKLLAMAAERGVRLAVLSNAPASLARAVRGAAWSACFETLVFSSEVALMKPDPRIYPAADRKMGVSPPDVVFFDDRPANVDAARGHGWRAHVWPGAEEAWEILAREGVLDG